MFEIDGVLVLAVLIEYAPLPRQCVPTLGSSRGRCSGSGVGSLAEPPTDQPEGLPRSHDFESPQSSSFPSSFGPLGAAEGVGFVIQKPPIAGIYGYL